MSLETSVDQNFMEIPDRREKEEEVARLKAEQGIAEVEEPGSQYGCRFLTLILGGDGNAGQGNEPNILMSRKEYQGAAAGSQ